MYTTSKTIYPIMLRGATIKARAIAAEATARIAAAPRSRSSFAHAARVMSQVRFTSSHYKNDGLIGDDGLPNKPHFARPEPIPLPAVAYDYDFYDGDDDDDGDSDGAITNSSTFLHKGLASKTTDVTAAITTTWDPASLLSTGSGNGTGTTTNKPYPPPSSSSSPTASLHGNGKPMTSTRKVGGGGGGTTGGGGGGRHRCPKCGTYTIFSHNEFGNSFYCATCSGWFTAAETLEGDENLMKAQVRDVIRFIYFSFPCFVLLLFESWHS